MLRRLPLALVSFAAVSAWGQNAISARSGMVNHVEGQVFIEGKAIDPKFGQFPQVNNDETLSTQEGRAEVLLTPGVFLRLAENSSFKMLSNRLSDTAIEVASGSAMLEVDELLKDNSIAVHFKGGTVSLAPKQGIYRFDEDLARMRVYEGEAHVVVGEHSLTARKGKQVAFGDTLVASSFDTKITDPFYRWANRRAEYISTANISAARTAGANGLLSGYSSWAWNPWFGMYTFLPGVGYGYSPFGWDFYSPATVAYIYTPYLYGGGGGSSYPALGRVTAPPRNSISNSGVGALTPVRATPPSQDNSSNGGSPGSFIGSRSDGGGGGSSPSPISSGGGMGSRGGVGGGGGRGR